jgi:threonine/homoserine/homoserine lactone efflux protein
LGAFDGLVGLVLTSAVLIAVPGPSILFLVGQTLSVGRQSALRAVVGNALGAYGVGVVLAVGIGSLILRSDAVMLAIQGFGAVVLCAIGLRYILATQPLGGGTGAGDGRATRRQSLVSGAIVGFTNPKALIMFGTIVPSFMAGGTESPIATLLVYSLIPVGLGLVIDALWVLTAHAASVRLLRAERSLRLVNAAGGALIFAMGVLLALEATGVTGR